MTAAVAPALKAFCAFVAKVHVPRCINAIAPAGKVAKSELSQPLVFAPGWPVVSTGTIRAVVFPDPEYVIVKNSTSGVKTRVGAEVRSNVGVAVSRKNANWNGWIVTKRRREPEASTSWPSPRSRFWRRRRAAAASVDTSTATSRREGSIRIDAPPVAAPAEIADQNEGTRASGLPGFTASEQYVGRPAATITDTNEPRDCRKTSESDAELPPEPGFARREAHKREGNVRSTQARAGS